MIEKQNFQSYYNMDPEIVKPEIMDSESFLLNNQQQTLKKYLEDPNVFFIF